MESAVELREVLKAKLTVDRNLRATQLIRYESLSSLIGADLYIKHENHHPVYSQKIRGAVNLAWELRSNGISEVVAVCSQEFGLALAHAGDQFAMKVRLIAPVDTPDHFLQQLRQTGAEISLSGSSQDEALRIAEGVQSRTGLYLLNPLEEQSFISGCGTACLEVFEELPHVDVIVAPVGSGACLASTLAVATAVSPKTRVFGVGGEQFLKTEDSMRAPGLNAGRRRLVLPPALSRYRNFLCDVVPLTPKEEHEGIALTAHHTRQIVGPVGGSTVMAAFQLKPHLEGKTVVLMMSSCYASPHLVDAALALPSFRNGIPAAFGTVPADGP